LIGGKAADTLSAVILNQDDPALIESGLPAYLLAVDGLISQNPDSAAMLSAGAQLFALYGSRFTTPDRRVTLTEKARRYGDRAICLAHEPACHWADADYTRFVAELEGVGKKEIGPLYSYAVAWLAQLDATSEDDVLALTRALNLRELIEDELLLALPLVPMHPVCPTPLQVEKEGLEVAEEANPFAVLAALKRERGADH